ncbi:MAG: glycosyl transferase family 2 [Bacteroidales bacterium]|nr:glycosyl transferase family 2 [Bacteroidales bacterium]
MKTGIIIQARAGSTRLPDKVILPFYQNEPIIEIILDRIQAGAGNIPLVLATTENVRDEVLCRLAEKKSVNCFCGPEDDVLERFILAALKYGFDRIIRICADNPFFDIDGTLALLNGEEDYIAYHITGDIPSIKSHLGFWGEVVSLEALMKVRSLTSGTIYHEHVTNYIYTHPGHFRIKWYDAPANVYERTDVRLTIDDRKDFVMGMELFAEIKNAGLPFKPGNILSYLDQHRHYLDTMKSQIRKYSK